MTKKENQLIYVSPDVRTIEIATQAIICQSGGITDMTVGEDGGESFN